MMVNLGFILIILAIKLSISCGNCFSQFASSEISQKGTVNFVGLKFVLGALYALFFILNVF